MRDHGDLGQATVEFALVLPLVLLVLVAGLQLVIVARDQVLVVNAARVAARVATTNHDLAAITDAARKSSPGLNAERLSIEVEGERAAGRLVSVTARYRQPLHIPFASLAWRDEIDLKSEVAMPVELP